MGRDRCRGRRGRRGRFARTRRVAAGLALTCAALTATLAEGAGYTIGSSASATTTVTDDDLSVVSVERVQESVAEGEEIQFTLTRTGQGDLTVTVELTLQGDFFAADQPTQMTATFGPRTQR